MAGFCPKCGKKGIKGDLCSKCHQEEHPAIEKFKETKVEFCIKCDRYKPAAIWKSFKRENLPNRNSLVKKIVHKNLKLSKSIPQKDMHITFSKDLDELIKFSKNKPGTEKKLAMQIKIKQEIYTLPLKISFTICPNCSKEKTQYFEGILQLRNETDEVMKFFKKEMNKAKRQGIYANKVVPNKNGTDYYITSQTFLPGLGKKLQNRFGGTLKVSAELFSQNKLTSKEVYRVNVYFKAPEFKRGDVVAVNDKIIKITQMGKRVSGMNLKINKKTSFPYKIDNKNLNREKITIIPQQETTIAKVYPHLEVLDKHYQPIKITNQIIKQGKTFDIGQKVKVVEWKRKVYLLN